MDDFGVRITLLVVLLVALLGLALWWSWRRDRKEQHEHVAELTALAKVLAGTVAGPDYAIPRSAGLLAPFPGDLASRLSVARRPRFDLALDFQHGPWQVRVSEASVKKNVSNGTRTFHEHRIEIVTGHLASTKIGRLLVGFRGRPIAPEDGPARAAPWSVAQRQGEWRRARLPAPAAQEFGVFADDLAATARMLTPEALAHLVARAAALPYVLTFEAGLLYATMAGRIEPDTVLATVDAMTGLLDRIPGAGSI